MEKIIDKLKKIEALATSGIGGERENAQKLLQKLCDQHGISPEELIQDKKITVKFTVKDRHDEKLLFQIVAHICRSHGVQYSKLKNKSTSERWFELSQIQAIDVQECFQHYRKLWRNNLDDIMSAFIHANSIFGPPSGEDKQMPDADAIARMERIVSIMAGMEANPWKKRFRLSA